jgi:uncharacterized membrane protein YphA (DoxX/SURF4 family)
MRWILCAGRLLFGGLFLWSATQHVLHAEALSESLSAHSVPYPGFALAASTLLLTVGGLSIVLGFMPRVGLSSIILFLIPATFIMHAFWSVDATARGVELAIFLKNVALIGAALSLLALSVPWPISIDNWLRHRARFSADGAFARVWRRVVERSRQVLQPKRARSRAPAEQIVSSPATISHSGGDSWVVREQAVKRADGSIVMRSVRAYFYSA